MNNALNVMSQIIAPVSVLLQGYFLQYFYCSFLEERFAKKHMTGILTAVLYAVLKIGITELIPADYGGMRTFMRIAAMFVILLVLAGCFYKAANRITIFLIITFMAINEISFFLAYMVLIMSGSLIDLYAWFVNTGIIVFPYVYEKITWATIFLSQVLMYVTFTVLQYLSLRKIVRDFSEKDYAIQKTELLFLLAPGLVGLLICVFLRIIIIMVENGVPQLLYDKYPILAFLVPMILILSLLSILCGVKLFQDMICFNREKSGRIVLERQVKSLQEHIGEMERIHSDIRGMKHDMKNTLSVIMRLADKSEENENKELQDYLLELNKSMDRLDFRFKTGNSVVDILLNMKYHEIMRDVPDLEMDANRLIFSNDLLIDSYDMGIIIGNALDNALEACRKQKNKAPDSAAFVRLSSFQKGKMIFIDIENSFDGKLIRVRQKEFPITDKEDLRAHGMGLANIKNAVREYHGAVDWSVNNKIFTLSIMMQNERRAENGY